MAVVADLVINKPLGWSPPGIEFKRAHLYDINPVGVGAMGVASLLSIAAYLGAARADGAGLLGVDRAGHRASSPSPLIAWGTSGRYYLARAARAGAASAAGSYKRLTRCAICERDYERDDMALLPGLQRRDLLAVLLAGRPLPRPVQARRAPVGAVDAACARLLPRAAVAVP